MLLNYVDESYDKRLYWISSLACRDREAIPLATALDAVAAKAAGAYGLSFNQSGDGAPRVRASRRSPQRASPPRSPPATAQAPVH